MVLLWHRLCSILKEYESLDHRVREDHLTIPLLFAIVIYRNNLPNGEGFEILKMLKKQNPKLIPILMTVRNDELSKQQAMRAGIQGYLE
jgi:DNA-binding NarL/FixJ family response regulator